MSCNFLLNPSFHEGLLEIDRQTAQSIQEKGCCHCSGTLHQSNYPRAGFGVLPTVAPLYVMRFSFSCANCRRRTTPPSIRFFGRRRYIFSIAILLCALQLSPSESRCARLVKYFRCHVSLSTWHRWRAWWRDTFPLTPFWHIEKARLAKPINPEGFPAELLRRFSAHGLSGRLQKLLSFLSPLSVSS
jgi:hypothetical protein